MRLEDIVLALSVVLLVAQAFAWRWSIGIERSLRGEIGADLAAVISGILGWTLLARVFGIVGLFAYDVIGDPTPPLVASVVGQVIGGLIFLWAASRIYQLRQPPVDAAGEAVVEEDAQPVAEIPSPTDNVGTPVDDASLDHSSVPAELHEGSAG